MLKGKPLRKRNLPGVFYLRRHDYRHPLLTPVALLLVRLYVRSTVAGDCWVFRGRTSGGGRGGQYGRIYYQGKTWAVHRLIYWLFVGPLEPGMHVAHSTECTSRACWRPKHLTQKTQSENEKDKGRAWAFNTPGLPFDDGVQTHDPS